MVPAENPGGAVFGLIAIGALMAAESGLHETYLDTVLSAVIAAGVYWLFHAYTTLLGGAWPTAAASPTARWRARWATIGR